MVRARIREDEGLAAVCRRLGAPMAACSGCGERDGGERTRQEALAADWREFAGTFSLRGRSVCGDVQFAGTFSLRGRWGTGGRAPSGREWNGSQPGQGATELGFPRPALWQMQGEAACRAGEPSGQGEEPPSEGLGGHDLLTQADAGCPAGQGCGPSPVPPARRRWRRNTPTACGSARHRT